MNLESIRKNLRLLGLLLTASMLSLLVACGGENPKPAEPEAQEVNNISENDAEEADTDSSDNYETSTESEENDASTDESANEKSSTDADSTDSVVTIAPAPSFKIFFEYDMSNISDEFKYAMNTHANYLLNENLETSLVLEGHADERGTREYNLALGERRAMAVKDYLVAEGVDPDRVSIISFGEDVPLDPGHNPTAWTANRRVQFNYEN